MLLVYAGSMNGVLLIAALIGLRPGPSEVAGWKVGIGAATFQVSGERA